ncbi:hypothetical protein NC651_007916 [Populus alba x Populus x berolinensis]|nr:hypothetical protein NC651_007916 [Populus alba x Populus x berolinensis]
MKPSQPMQVISRRLTSPRAPSTPPQSEHAPDKVDEKTPGSLSSREESAGTPTPREERRKTERKRGGEPVMDTGDWRIQLRPDSRKRIVDKIYVQEGLQELKKFAIRFEEKIYTTATNQYDYLRKISLEMLSMEIRSQNTMPTAPMDPTASHSMPPEVQNQGLFLPILLSTDQSQARQQLVSQNMQNCMASNGVQSYAGLQTALPPVSGVTQTIPNTVVQNPNMQSIPGVSQNSVGNSMGQGIPSTMFVNSQRQMPASLDSTAQTGHAKGADWQEEIYQKVISLIYCSLDGVHYAIVLQDFNGKRRPIFAEQFYNEKLVTDVLKTGVKEWLRVHGDHVKIEAVEKAITQIMMGEEAEEMSSRAKKRPGRLLKKVDLHAPISML